jgi:hypothetical protein
MTGDYTKKTPNCSGLISGGGTAASAEYFQRKDLIFRHRTVACKTSNRHCMKT